MKLTLYDLWNHLEEYHEDSYEVIYNILQCFIDNSEKILFSVQKEFVDDNCINKKFIQDKTVCVSSEWMYNFPISSLPAPEIVWFEVSNLEEIEKSLEIDYLFNCVIIKHGAEIRDAEYIINSNEDLEYNSLSIREKYKGNFANNVVPKLRKILVNDLEIVDKRNN
ncbi:hypothetical protein [Clostridium manihotivorum]|uniref:Uncharacterized protein n=1 Tax=Clostridium manihotivorum TaxID=2320868 RepID=A0A3R5QWC7_9CLOT|nr:hypothetical protein [Clostridium manihotivorum]QAA33757.1 hypothetical protein C1I91_20175 [Clostridium manihotivorum]